MDSSNILRWLRYLVWVAGFFTVWCPVCICLSGSAAWLVCATTIGLTSIVIVSSYTTWTVFHHFLNKGKPLENFFTRYIFTSNIKNNEDVFLNDCKFLDPSVLEKEISSTAQTFYLHLILPWYSYISPDEKYALQALVQKPSINVSFPLKEFLAYGSSDSSIAFSKKHLEINVPRLDKILARTVSGVFQSLKTALPNFDSVESLDVTSNCGLPSSSLSQPQPTYLEDGTLDTAACDKRQYLEITMPIRKTFEVQLDITADEQICEMEKTLLAAVTSSQLNSPNESSENLEMKLSPVPSLVFSFKSASSSSLSETLETASKKQFIRDLDLQMIREESTEDANLEVDFEDCKSISLFSTLVDAAVELISSSNHPVTLQICTYLFKRICAEPSTDFIKAKMNSFLSIETVQDWLNQIKAYIIEIQNGDELPCSTLMDDEFFKNNLRDTIRDFMPCIMKLLLGKDVTEQSIILFIESLQHPLINQDFCLHFFDLLFANLLVAS